MRRKILRFATIMMHLSIVVVIGCKKQDDWLNVKRLSNEVTPRTLMDYQAILNYDNTINQHFITLGLLGTDNFYLTDSAFPSVTQTEQDGYLWKSSLWDSNSGNSNDWNYMFTIIEDANIVLDGLKDLDPNLPGYNDLKGQALFYRSICNYTLAQLFCKPFNNSTAQTDLGLPLRLSSDVNIIYPRSSTQKTYDQIISDATESINLLPDQPTLNYRRPFKYAAQGLLAKVYLAMSDYHNAGLYADQVLKKTPALFDFNSNLITTSNTYRFPANGLNNPEILFYASASSYFSVRPTTSSKAYVDTLLYSSYSNNDLRKKYFYTNTGGHQQFIGNYTGTSSNFCGIATNEIYLIRAECYARQDDKISALADLNSLLKKRFITGTFTDLSAGDSKAALTMILQERRKELPFTANLRWEDLRRLNKDVDYQKSVIRKLNGITYTLLPNDPKYIFSIPSSEVQLSGLQQN